MAHSVYKIRTRHRPRLNAAPITLEEAERLLAKRQPAQKSMDAMIDAFEARVPARAMRTRTFVAENGAKVTVCEPLCEDCAGQGCFECGNTGYRRD
jgi:hypothetical protein